MASIPSGSTTLFIQSWSPVGWTRDLTYDDYGLRVTNIAGSDNTSASGWTTTVGQAAQKSWTWASTITNPTGSALSVNPAVGELASHTHTFTSGYISYTSSSLRQYPGGAASGRAGISPIPTGTTSGSTGSPAPAAHTHPLAFSATPGVTLSVGLTVKYIDAIIATRD